MYRNKKSFCSSTCTWQCPVLLSKGLDFLDLIGSSYCNYRGYPGASELVCKGIQLFYVRVSTSWTWLAPATVTIGAQALIPVGLKLLKMMGFRSWMWWAPALVHDGLKLFHVKGSSTFTQGHQILYSRGSSFYTWGAPALVHNLL